MTSQGDEKQETVSRKPRRGRPSAIPPEVDSDFEKMGLYGDVKTRRSRVNFHYRIDAIGVLKHDPARFGWIYDREAGVMRGTILTELGRIGDPETIRAAADRICALRPTSAQAAAMIRGFRLGGLREGTLGELGAVLLRAIDAYSATHQVDDAMILGAIERARHMVERIQAHRKSESVS